MVNDSWSNDMTNENSTNFMGSFMQPFKGRGQDNKAKSAYSTFNQPSNVVQMLPINRRSPRFKPRNEAIFRPRFERPIYRNFGMPKQNKWSEIFKGVNLGAEPSISNRNYLGQLPQFFRSRV